MNPLLNRMKESGLIDQSLLSAFVELSPVKINEYEIPLISYAFCLYTSSLIQMYFIKRVQQKDNSQSFVLSLEDVGNNKKLFEQLTQCWDGNEAEDLADGETVFSFLYNCSQLNDGNLIYYEYLDDNQTKNKTGELLDKICQQYKTYRQSNTQSFIKTRYHLNPKSTKDFFALLRAMPILKNTSFDIAKQELTIKYNQNSKYEFIRSSAEPFFYMPSFDYESGGSISKNYLYCLTSVQKGENDNEIYFVMANPFIVQKDSPLKVRYRKCFLYANEHSENEIAVCQTMGINTVWQRNDLYTGDYAFLKRLTKAIKNVIINYFKMESNANSANSYRDLIEELFGNKKIENKLKDYTVIDEKNIDVLITELFILFGVFNVVYYLLLNDQDNHDKLFCDLINELKQLETEQGNMEIPYDTYYEQCMFSIRERENDLTNIFPRGTEKYKKRAAQIKAAWLSMCLLKSAGIRNDNLFADEEKMLYIDDYYYMLENEAIDNDLLLGILFKFLIRFYLSLLAAGTKNGEFDLKRFILHSKKILAEQKISEGDVAIYAQKLSDIIESSGKEKHPIIEKMLGRNSISDYGDFYDYIHILLEMRKKAVNDASPINFNMIDQYEQKNQPYVFLCYSHKDKDRVEHDIQKLRSLGYNVIYDALFKDNWLEEDIELIKSENCCGVIFCLSIYSVTSHPIWEETVIADEYNKKKILISYESGDIVTIIEKIIADKLKVEGADKNAKATASDIHKKLMPGYGLYIKRTDECFETKLCEKIDELLSAKLTPSYSDEYILAIKNLFAFLKVGEKQLIAKKPERAFNEEINVSHCIYPLIVSVKETTIKRDCITLTGYEIVQRQENAQSSKTQYILTEQKVMPGEYYCIPHYRKTSACGEWMIEPLLISCNDFEIETIGRPDGYPY